MQYDNETKYLIEQLDKQFKEIKAKIDELKNGENKCVRWRAKEGESFYIVSGYACSDKYAPFEMTEDFGVCCNFHYNTGDYFKTAQEARKHYKHLIITQKLKDIASRLNDGVNIDWNNTSQRKFSLCYSYNYLPSGKLCQDSLTRCYFNQGTTYCLSDKFLETAIKEIGEKELIEYIKKS